MTREELAALIVAELVAQGEDAGAVEADRSRLDRLSLDGEFDILALADAILAVLV